MDLEIWDSFMRTKTKAHFQGLSQRFEKGDLKTNARHKKGLSTNFKGFNFSNTSFSRFGLPNIEFAKPRISKDSSFRILDSPHFTSQILNFPNIGFPALTCQI